MKKLILYKKYFISTCLIGLSILFLASCATQKEESCGFVKNGSDHRLSWNNNLPVALWMHPNVPDELKHALYTGAETWEENYNKDFFNIQELPEGSSVVPRRDSRSIIYWDDQWGGNKDKASEQAKTTIYWMGSQIIDSDIRFNAQDYAYYTNADLLGEDNIFAKNNEQNINKQASTNNSNIINHLVAFIEQRSFKTNVITQASNILPAYINLRSDYINGVESSYYIHLESLVIHEFGHVLGLDHNGDDESVMQERLSARTQRDEIGESDYNNIACEYGSDT